MKPFDPDQIKTFRTPKYGGVALSLLSMFVLGSMVVVWNNLSHHEQSLSSKTIRVLCEDSLSEPVNACLEQFEAEMGLGVAMTVSSASSDENDYDLIVSTDLKPTAVKTDKRPMATLVPIASRQLVFATRRNFPNEILTVDDINNGKLTFASSPYSSQAGKILVQAVRKAGLWDEFSSHKDSSFEDSRADALKLSKAGNLDGVFVWASSAKAMNLKIHNLRELENTSEEAQVKIGLTAKNRPACLQFARFLAAPEGGQSYFAEAGFAETGRADAWSPEPSLFVYCDQGLSDSLKSRFQDFEKRDGVAIDTHFILQKNITPALDLIAQSKAKRSLPDLILGEIENSNEQIMSRYEVFDSSLFIKKKKQSIYLLTSSRYPFTARILSEYLLERN